MINNNPGTLRGKASRIEIIQEVFNFLFDNKMFELLLTERNWKTREKLTTFSKYKERLFESSRNFYLKEANLQELKAFIGLLYCHGLYGDNHYSLKNSFSTERGPPIYIATISQNRMAFLLANISFENEEGWVARWPTDRFAATKSIFEYFQH